MNSKSTIFLFNVRENMKLNIRMLFYLSVFFADFVVYDQIIPEVKARKGVVDEHFRWLLNYLDIKMHIRFNCKLW